LDLQREEIKKEEDEFHHKCPHGRRGATENRKASNPIHQVPKWAVMHSLGPW